MMLTRPGSTSERLGGNEQKAVNPSLVSRAGANDVCAEFKIYELDMQSEGNAYESQYGHFGSCLGVFSKLCVGSSTRCELQDVDVELWLVRHAR